MIVIAGSSTDNGTNAVTAIDVTKSSGGATITAAGFTTIFGSTGYDSFGDLSHLFIAYAVIATSGSLTLAITPTMSGTPIRRLKGSIDEFSGGDTTSPLDVNGGELVSGVPATSVTDTITTITANDLIVGIMGVGDSSQTAITDGSGYSNLGQSADLADYSIYDAEFKIVGAASTYNVDWTWDSSSRYSVLNAAFKAAAAPVDLTGAFIMA